MDGLKISTVGRVFSTFLETSHELQTEVKVLLLFAVRLRNPYKIKVEA